MTANPNILCNVMTIWKFSRYSSSLSWQSKAKWNHLRRYFNTAVRNGCDDCLQTYFEARRIWRLRRLRILLFSVPSLLSPSPFLQSTLISFPLLLIICIISSFPPSRRFILFLRNRLLRNAFFGIRRSLRWRCTCSVVEIRCQTCRSVFKDLRLWEMKLWNLLEWKIND